MTVLMNLPGKLRLKRTVKILRNLLLITISLLFGYTGCNNSYLLLTYLNGETLSPMPLTILPENSTITTLGEAVFTAAGGTEPYTYSVASGMGSIDSGTGIYTPPPGGPATQTVIIMAVDPFGESGQTSVTVKKTSQVGIWISPAAVTLDEGETLTFRAGGGSGPYTFSITYGDGTIAPGTETYLGEYTAPFLPSVVGIAHIQVDDGSDVTEAIVQIRDPGAAISISPSPLVSYVNNPVLMTAVGGTPPINWGTTEISSSSTMFPGATATYTPTSAGVGMISVVDGDTTMVNIPVMVLVP